jgi:hypothetical protein
MPDSIVTPIPGFHQVAYVTSDFDRALKVFAEVHRAKQFMELRDIRYPTGPGREAHCNIGLAYVGATELEVIEPLGDDVQIYRDFLPAGGFAIRFHHISRFLETRQDYDQQFAAFQKMGKPIPIIGLPRRAGPLHRVHHVYQGRARMGKGDSAQLIAKTHFIVRYGSPVDRNKIKK